MPNEINVGTSETINKLGVVEEVETSENNESEEETEGESDEKVEAEKPKESSEDRLARLERQAKQLRRKLGKDEPVKFETKKVEKQSNDFNEGQLAYLSAKGIDSDEDVDFTMGELKKHGGNLRELLGNEYFKSKLEARKQAKIALDATPTNSHRSNQGTRDEAEMHYAKYLSEGENYLSDLPLDMRAKVVNMRLVKVKKESQFTNQPVVGNW